MNKVKKMITMLVAGLCVVLLCASSIGKMQEVIFIEDEQVPLAGGQGTLISETEDDINVIPDKYNTGAMGELKTVEHGAKVGSIQLKVDGSKTKNVIDFYYGNGDVTGTVVIENADFSEYPVAVYNEKLVTRTIKVIFNNCKFSSMSTGQADSTVSYEFNNCTINSFAGSNASFNRCKFGENYSDCLVPYRNVTVNNCFFSDMGIMKAEGSEEHSDGTQIYGYPGIEANNIVFDNCRFEIPPIKVEGSKATINACIMLQLEFSNASNISFTNCITNGGGYTIYAWDKNKGYTLEDITLKDIRVGSAKLYGTFYPIITSTVNVENVTDTDSLYVASVWKSEGKTHLSVSNDTNQERVLLVYTSKGKYEYEIPACPRGSEILNGEQYSDMPFDMDIVVPEECEYIVCYDATLEGYATQIRFVNWTDEEVYFKDQIIEDLFSGKNDVLYSGQCGAGVSYAFSKAGVMILSGTGATDSYHSKKPVPWSDYSEKIKCVIVEKGVETIGEQMFRGCSSLQTVILADGLKSVGKMAFSGCFALKSIVLPATVESIGANAFPYEVLTSIGYEGTDWKNISISDGDKSYISKVIEYVVKEEQEYIVIEGKCGASCSYMLMSNGVLHIMGSGEMYNYHSLNVAPWYEHKEMIQLAKIEEGITKIGEQAFRNCYNLRQVDLPGRLVVIGKNAFISCSSLESVYIPKSVTKIQPWAFAGAGIQRAYYAGTEVMWDMIDVGALNDVLENNLVFMNE